jgi:DNA-binding NtrC family response regulator
MQADIVLVDDDALTIRALTRVLARAGLPVWATTDASKALERLERAPPLAVVADHQMPGMTGLELLARSRMLAPRSRRVLITGSPTLDVLQQAINESQIHCFFPKPLQTHELVNALTEIYDGARDQRRIVGDVRRPATERSDAIRGDELLGAALAAAGSLGLNLRGR